MSVFYKGKCIILSPPDLWVDIYTEHLHPSSGKFHYDQNHKDRLERGEKDNVNNLYFSLWKERRNDAEKLSKVINESQK